MKWLTSLAETEEVFPVEELVECERTMRGRFVERAVVLTHSCDSGIVALLAAERRQVGDIRLVEQVVVVRRAESSKDLVVSAHLHAAQQQLGLSEKRSWQWGDTRQAATPSEKMFLRRSGSDARIMHGILGAKVPLHLPS